MADVTVDGASSGRSGGLSLLVRPFTLACALGAVAVGVFSLGRDQPWAVLGSAIMVAVACVAAGGLLGVPMAIAPDVSGGLPSEPVLRSPRYVGNANLEQISDWLTKILVGVTLTQLGAIRDGAADLFDALAPALGGDADSPVFAWALVVYFGTFGFVLAWLLARVLLGTALTQADLALELLVRAERAKQGGESEQAVALRRQAADALAGLASTASRYEELRRLLTSSPQRTRELEQLLDEVRHIMAGVDVDVTDVAHLFAEGGDGGQTVALALMQTSPDVIHPRSVVDAHGHPRSAFEQYHALVAAKLWLDRCPPPAPHDREALAAAARGIVADSEASADHRSRARLVVDRLQGLGESDGVASVANGRVYARRGGRA